jgi:hypothetical protein
MSSSCRSGAAASGGDCVTGGVAGGSCTSGNLGS